jgi:hypothetical protein
VYKVPCGPYLIAVFAAVGPQLGILQMKNMRDVFFGGGDAPGVLAEKNVFNLFGELEFDLFGDLFMLDDVYRDIGIDKAQNVKVDSNSVIDLDDVLAAHPF